MFGVRQHARAVRGRRGALEILAVLLTVGVLLAPTPVHGGVDDELSLSAVQGVDRASYAVPVMGAADVLDWLYRGCVLAIDARLGHIPRWPKLRRHGTVQPRG